MNDSAAKETQSVTELPFVSSQGGTSVGYKVQARFMSHQPEQFGDIILDQRWKELHFPSAPIGVPACRPFEHHLMATQCLNYEAAQALRWWFLANCTMGRLGGRLCVETRIVRCRIEYNWKGSAEAVLEEDPDAWREGTI